jgi:hypothetical protein
MKTNNESEPIEVFEGTSIEAGSVQSLLEESGIQSFIQNEFMGSIAPWQVTGGGAGAVKVIVAESDYEAAAKLINDYGIKA